MNENNDQTTVAQQAADFVDNVTDNVKSAAHTVRQAAGRAASAVEHTYEEAGRFARESVNHGRARIRSWEESFEDSVRENPKTFLLLAAALGAVAVALWKRR
ncbi:MAG: hypothetical protein ABSG31_00835 [Tepidisphaeraceae bacterium]|jgi:ElaB/YqjD/DUF883 family membrane-anchored ribosome-binding protein